MLKWEITHNLSKLFLYNQSKSWNDFPFLFIKKPTAISKIIHSFIQ